MEVFLQASEAADWTLRGALTPRREKVLPSNFPRLPYVGLEHVESNTRMLIGVGCSSGMKSAANKFYPGDVLYSRLRPYLNKVWLADREGLCSAEFIVIPGNDSIDAKFLCLRLSARDFVSFANGLNAGDRPRVDFDQIGGFKLPEFSITYQKRIVEKIEELFSELDQGIENLKKARAQLAVYRQALLKHAFEGKLTAEWRKTHEGELESADQLLSGMCKNRKAGCDPVTEREASTLPKLPQGWVYARFGEYIELMEAGKSFRCDERPPKSDEIGVAKVSAVSWGEYQELESKTCVDLEKVNPGYFIREGDFLLSRANTIDLVGACVIVRNVTLRIMLSDKTLRLVIRDIPKEYFLQYLRSRQGRREIVTRSTGNQESMRNIGQERIRSIIVPIPSNREVAKIIELLSSYLESIAAEEVDIEQSLQRAESLRQSILKKAFAGELVPQDPNDEPASELLARIRDERAKQDKTSRRAKALRA